MEEVKGMIEEVQSKTVTSKKNGQKYELVVVRVLGEEYKGFAREWGAKLKNPEGKWCLIRFDKNDYGDRNIKELSIIPVPSESEMAGIDAPKMSEKDVWIAKLNCNTATATVLGKMAQFGMFTDRDQLYAEWEKAYKFNCKLVGLDG